MGAGKSTALAALERLGAATLSTDAVVHELYARPRGRRGRRRALGRGGRARTAWSTAPRDGRARRSPPAEEREWLEELLWPRVGRRVAAWREEQAGRDPAPRAAVVETPLLFEAGMDGLYDATIAVVAAEEVRAERAAARGHAAVDERAARQLPQEEKARRATYVVVNDGDASRQLRDRDAVGGFLGKLRG